MRRITNLKTAVIGASLIVLGATRPALADFFVHHWEDHHQNVNECTFTPEFVYYNTTANFGADSKTVTPSGFTSYDRSGLDINGECGFSDRFTLFGNLSWSRVDVVSQALNAADYGLSDQTLGMNYRLTAIDHTKLAAAIDLQAQVDFPAYSNSSQALSPYLGDQTLDFSLGAFGTLPLGNVDSGVFAIVGGLGYTQRNKGFSSAIPYSALLEFKRTDVSDNEGFFFQLGLYGLRSLNNDSNSPNFRSNPQDGGTYFIYATDPTLIDAGGELGYRTSLNTSIIVGGAQSIAGTNAPQGLTIYGGLSFRLGHVESGDPVEQSPAEYGKSNQGLVQYTAESHVTAVNDRMNLIKIDKGSNDEVEVGQVYDIFSVSSDGTPIEAIARAKVTSVKPAESALKITEYYKQTAVNTGAMAKRPLE